MSETLSLEEARRIRQIRLRHAFDVEQGLKEKVKNLKSVTESGAKWRKVKGLKQTRAQF